jgi:hypothetical protein
MMSSLPIIWKNGWMLRSFADVLRVRGVSHTHESDSLRSWHRSVPVNLRERYLTGLLPKSEVRVRNVGGASARRPVQHSAASWPWTPTHGIPKTNAVCGLKSILFWFCVGQPPFRQLSGVVAALRYPPTFSLKTSVDLSNRPLRSRHRLGLCSHSNGRKLCQVRF